MIGGPPVFSYPPGYTAQPAFNPQPGYAAQPGFAPPGGFATAPPGFRPGNAPAAPRPTVAALPPPPARFPGAPPAPQSLVRAKADEEPVARSQPLSLPSPDQLGLARRSGDGVDWAATHRRCKSWAPSASSSSRPAAGIVSCASCRVARRTGPTGSKGRVRHKVRPCGWPWSGRLRTSAARLKSEPSRLARSANDGNSLLLLGG